MVTTPRKVTKVPQQRRKPRELVVTTEHAIGDANWMRDGSCYGVTTNIFFPEDDELPSEAAQLLCHRCPVRESCLQWALEHDEEGYWGGTTKPQRDAINSGRHRVKCPMCASRDIVELGTDTVCINCGLSW